MPCMSFGEKSLHFATVKIDPLFIFGNNDTLLVNGLNDAVQFASTVNAINPFGAFDELFRVDHVRCTPRVDYATRIRQVLHEQARTTRVIEVYVGQKNEIDIGRIKVALPQSVKQQGNAVVRTRIDESATATFDNQVACVLQGAAVLGVDGENAIIKCCNLCAAARHQFTGASETKRLLGRRRFEAFEAREVARQQCHIFFRD